MASTLTAIDIEDYAHLFNGSKLGEAYSNFWGLGRRLDEAGRNGMDPDMSLLINSSCCRPRTMAGG